MKRFFWPILAYTIVIVFVFVRALWPGATEMIWGDDIHRQYYFYRQFFNNFLSQGIWPWWNPYTFAGAPFMANPIVNMWYLPSWLYVVLPLTIAYSWHIALHLLWAMLGMYVLLRRLSSSDLIRGSSLKQILDPRLRGDDTLSLGPWVGGLVFGFSGFFTARIWAGHVDVIAAASWMPWVVYAFGAISNIQYPISKQESHLQNLSGRRAIVLAAGALAMQLFAGYQTMAMLTLEAVGIMTVVTLIARRASMREIIVTMGRTAMSVLLAVGLFAVVLLPQQEFFRQTIRTYTLPYFWNAYGSLTWQSLGQFINPFFFGDQITYAGPPPNFAEHAFFVGRTGLFLFIVIVIMWTIRHLLFSQSFLLSSPRRRGSSFQSKMDSGSKAGMTAIVSFIAIALFGLWVSLGPNAPVDLQYILWKAIPMYHFLRIPPRHLILVAFGLSGMIGLAMNYLNPKFEYRNPKQYQNSNVLNSKQFRIFNFLQFEFVSNFVLRNSNFYSILVAGLIALELILYARHFIVLKPIPETRHDTELIKILKQDKEPYRVLTNFGAWAPPRDSFDFDAGMQYGVFNATGYDTMILRPYYEFIDAANNAKRPSILEHDVQIPYLDVFSKATDLLNIKYILHPRGYDPLAGSKDPRFRLLREDVVRDYRLYENTSVLPRFYFENNKEGKVEIKKYSPNEIILSTSNKGGDTLQSSEMYYPGWEGFINGKKVDIIKSNNTFRALFVPAGNYTVVYRYYPRIFIIGGVITLITAGIMVFLWKKAYDVGTSV